MAGRLEGKTAIVTGSGQNIGKACAILFAKEGANVIVNGSRSQEKVDAVVAEIKEAGGSAHGIMADVSDPTAWEAMVEETESVFGPSRHFGQQCGCKTPHEVRRNYSRNVAAGAEHQPQLLLLWCSCSTAEDARTQSGPHYQHVGL